MFVCLLDELILGFCYSDLTWETGEFELASTIALVLQANRLTKQANRVGSTKQMFYKNFTKFVRKYMCWSPLFNKLKSLDMQLLRKRDSGTGVFL